MNLILIYREELQDNRATITGDKLKHLRKILKVKVGDRVKVGIVGEKIGTGLVEAISRESALLQITTEREPPERLPIHLILAIPRPIMLKRVLAQAASIGIDTISLVRSKRVEKSFLESSIVEQENFTPALLKGLEQAVDTQMPQVNLFHRFKPLIENLAESTTEPNRLQLIAHPQGEMTLPEAARNAGGKRITVAIGPEGGWIDYEVEQFVSIGFTPFTLGERILRVDTAVPAILCQLELLYHASPKFPQ